MKWTLEETRIYDLLLESKKRIDDQRGMGNGMSDHELID